MMARTSKYYTRQMSLPKREGDVSLDVYLKLPGAKAESVGSGIFIREAGATREITRAEWDAKFPDRIPLVVPQGEDDDYVYSRNITHNLGRMADEAGIGKHLWEPDEIGITHAHQLIDPLREGLALLRGDSARFQAFNPSNGWGSYEGLVEFVDSYLAACERYPMAEVEVSR